MDSNSCSVCTINTYLMDFNSIKWTKRLRILFLVVGLLWILTISLLIFFDLCTEAVSLIGLFFVALAFVAILNFQYLRIVIDKDYLSVQYYSIFAFDRSFQMIEIPLQNLHGVEVRKGILGLKEEFRLAVKVDGGVADFPWISLSALPQKVNEGLITVLKNLVAAVQ